MLKDTLRSLRESKGLSQAKVADILGVSPAAYSTYEMGTRDVSSDKIVKLAEFYGVTTDYLYGIEDRNEDEISKKEKMFIKKYRKLDVHGKDMVDTVLNKEYDRSINLPNELKCPIVFERTYKIAARGHNDIKPGAKVTIGQMEQNAIDNFKKEDEDL